MSQLVWRGTGGRQTRKKQWMRSLVDAVPGVAEVVLRRESTTRPVRMSSEMSTDRSLREVTV